MWRKFFFFIIFSVFFAVFIYIGANLFKPNQPTPTWEPPAELEEMLIDTVDFQQPTPASLFDPPRTTSELKQTGWIPDWDFNNGYESLQAAPGQFDSISPVWYYLTESGGTRANRAGLDKIKTFASQRGLKLIPSIANFNADEFTLILDDEQKLEAHIDYLLSEVNTHELDGLDLDYESIYLDDQPEYLYLIRELYAELDKQGKFLTIAVMPNWSEADIFRSLRQTRQAQDWYEIGPYVHELRIMTYNLTDYVSTFAGPVSPLDWNEANIRYALPRVDREKIFLGINLYGYDGWSNNFQILDHYLGLQANPSAEKGQADAVTYAQVREWDKYKQSDILDPGSLEKILTYRFEDKDYIVYYQDAESARYRLDLAREYGIGGVAYWRLGDEDVRIYSL